MKAISLILTLLLALPAVAKEVTGRVVDASGEPVSYVNIGIRGTSTGTLSRRDGTFALTIPDSLASRALSFSHVSYRPVDTTPETTMHVVLQAAEYQAEEIVIRPGKSRKKRLSGDGFRIPSGSIGVKSDSTRMNPVSDVGAELGTIVEVNRDFIVKKIRFSINKCTDTAWMLRFNIYRVEGEEFTNVVREPVYFRFPLTKEPLVIETAFDQTLFLTPGRYFVAMEFVELGADLSLLFPAHIRSSYIRNSSMGRWEKCHVNIGLSVSGVEYD